MRSNTSLTLPVSTASPEYMTVMRSQVSRIRPRLCDTKIIDVPNFLPSPLTSSTMPASTVTSSAVVGSSSSKQRRLGQQRHGDHDALLLAARKLVRIGAHHALGIGQPHGAHHFERALVGLLLGDLVVDHRHFHQLLADLHRRIQACHRLLVDHGDLVAADRAKLLLGQFAHVLALELDAAADDLPDIGEVAHDAERHGRLAAAGFADDAHRLARHDGAGEVHHRRDFAAPGKEGDREVFDFEDRFGWLILAASFIISSPVSLSSIVRAARRRAD